MKDTIRERAAAGAAVMVSSHLLSLVEDLCTTLLVLRRGRMVWHGRLADLRAEASADGRVETLEDVFFRLTEGPATEQLQK
jgi:ABC-2 type transport system ATP-binding protein